MTAPRREDGPPSEPLLVEYTAVMATFTGAGIAFGSWFRASGRTLPERMEARDLALVTVAAHKLARLLTKERVTRPLRAPFTELEGRAGPAEVDERVRPGGGLRQTIGDLFVCPFCMGMWTSAGFSASLLVWPRATRWVASVLAAFFGTEVLHIAYRRGQQLL